jgi:hypothetical protein
LGLGYLGLFHRNHLTGFACYLWSSIKRYSDDFYFSLLLTASSMCTSPLLLIWFHRDLSFKVVAWFSDKANWTKFSRGSFFLLWRQDADEKADSHSRREDLTADTEVKAPGVVHRAAEEVQAVASEVWSAITPSKK